jgi:hypothetical protein
LPSPAFDDADLPSLRGGASAVELELGGSLLLDCEVLDELSELLEDAWFEDALSRDDGSVAGFRGGGSVDGSGACGGGVGSGCMLSSTSEAKLPMAGDGSRTTVFDGVLA